MKRIHHLVIGDGRLAKHLKEYFRLAGLHCEQWSRKSHDRKDLLEKVQKADRVLIAISDRAIAKFVYELPQADQPKCIHLSGCLSLDGIPSAHPLMTFGHELYDLKAYQKIPFIVEEPYHMRDLLPELINEAHPIKPADKALYHSLCVMSGNFSMLLWQKLFREFETQLGISRQAALPYMQKVFENLMNNPDGCLTGPIVRNDQSTIASNLNSLKTDPFLSVYRGFVEAFDTETRTKGYLQ